MTAAWSLLLVVLVVLGSAAASTEELKTPDLQLLNVAAPGAVDTEPLPRAADSDASTKDTFPGATSGECDSLNGDCLQQASGGEADHADRGADQPSKAEQEAGNMEEDMWSKKTIADRNVVDGIIDDDDVGDDEEYYEGSSLSSGGDHQVVVVTQGEAATGSTVDAAAAALDGSDDQTVPGVGGANTTTGGHPPETEKKKVPLREILLRLKPASLMDDEEREAAAAAAAADRNDQDGNATVAGSVDSRSLALGGGLPSEDSSSNTSKKAVCSATVTEEGVQLLNATGLQALVSPNTNSTGRSLPAPCLMVFFFSPRCRFSTAAAPAMTALARALQGAMPVYGVDSVQYHSINAQFGVMGTPQLVLFHNGFSVAHYNASTFTPDLLTSFLHHFTDHRMLEDIEITEEDVKDGPLPLTASPGGGWWLAASWLLLGGVASRCFVKSALCHRLVEAVLNNWREAEAQHQHQD